MLEIFGFRHSAEQRTTLNLKMGNPVPKTINALCYLMFFWIASFLTMTVVQNYKVE